MPLHTHGKTTAGCLDGLDASVWCIRRRDESVRDAMDRLVMKGVRRHILSRRHSQNCLQSRVGFNPYRVGRFGPGLLLGVHQTIRFLRGQVLPERTSKRHTHHLATTADCKDGKVTGNGTAHEWQLKGIAFGRHHNRVVHWRLAVLCGINVPAPGKQQPVNKVEHLVNLVRIRNRRQQERQPPGQLDGMDVCRSRADDRQPKRSILRNVCVPGNPNHRPTGSIRRVHRLSEATFNLGRWGRVSEASFNLGRWGRVTTVCISHRELSFNAHYGHDGFQTLVWVA